MSERETAVFLAQGGAGATKNPGKLYHGEFAILGQILVQCLFCAAWGRKKKALYHTTLFFVAPLWPNISQGVGQFRVRAAKDGSKFRKATEGLGVAGGSSSNTFGRRKRV